MTSLFLDYIEDSVASKLVNTSVLLAVIGVLFHFLYLIQTYITQYSPLFYMLGWFIVPSITCLFILIPLQLGNNHFKYSYTVVISIVWCLLLFAYESYTCYILVTSTNIPWFYFICLFASVTASFVAALCYLYMIIAKASYTTYADERAEEYEDIALNDPDEDIDKLERENHAFFWMLREIVWPYIPVMKGNTTIDYPSRVIVTVFLCLAGVIGFNELLTYFYIWSGEQLKRLSEHIDTLEAVELTDKSAEAQAAHSYSIAISKTIYTLTKPVSDSLLASSFIGLFWGIFGAVMIMRIWKQRMVYMRFGYSITGKKFSKEDLNDYPLWWSAKFMSSMACSIVFGSVMITALCSCVFGMILSVDVRSSLIESGIWKYVACYVGYYLLELIIFQFLLMKIWCKNTMDNKYASVVMMINDLTYIPMAALFCLVRIIQLIVLCLISFIRPDLSIFPGYLSKLDHAHVSFMSSIRLSVEKEKKYAPHSIDSENTDVGVVEIQNINDNVKR